MFAGDRTPLHCAASSNNMEAMQLLIEHGAGILAFTWDADRETPLDKCCPDSPGFDECYQFLEGTLSVTEHNTACHAMALLCLSGVDIYTVSQKNIHLTFGHNFGSCSPILKILLLTDSQVNCLCNCFVVFNLTLTALLYYLAKLKHRKFQLNVYSYCQYITNMAPSSGKIRVTFYY